MEGSGERGRKAYETGLEPFGLGFAPLLLLLRRGHWLDERAHLERLSGAGGIIGGIGSGLLLRWRRLRLMREKLLRRMSALL